MTHWEKILRANGVIKKTILVEGQVAGHIVCFQESGRWLVGYWLGRHVWGKGVATEALSQFLREVKIRPLHAYVAKHNVASVRVLTKCGFEVSGENVVSLDAATDPIEQFIMSLGAAETGAAS